MHVHIFHKPFADIQPSNRKVIDEEVERRESQQHNSSSNMTEAASSDHFYKDDETDYNSAVDAEYFKMQWW